MLGVIIIVLLWLINLDFCFEVNIFVKIVIRKKKIVEINFIFFKIICFLKINKDSVNIIRINMMMFVCVYVFLFIVLISDWV